MDFKDVGPGGARGEVEAGLVIHEGQLTAAEDGLRVVEDLGRSWKARTGLPLPLGMNAVRRDLPEPVRRAAAIAWKASIDYGLAHREEALDYAMSFARDLDRAKADTFVGMYVNDWTRELGAARPRGGGAASSARPPTPGSSRGSRSSTRSARPRRVRGGDPVERTVAGRLHGGARRAHRLRVRR